MSPCPSLRLAHVWLSKPKFTRFDITMESTLGIVFNRPGHSHSVFRVQMVMKPRISVRWLLGTSAQVPYLRSLLRSLFFFGPSHHTANLHSLCSGHSFWPLQATVSVSEHSSWHHFHWRAFLGGHLMTDYVNLGIWVEPVDVKFWLS